MGTYEIIVRAYDQSGNFREVTKKLSIVTPIFKILGASPLPRWLTIISGLIILTALAFFARWAWLQHRRVHLKYIAGAIKDPAVAEKLKQLQKKRSQYMKHWLVIVAALLIFGGWFSVGSAQTTVLAPPIITTISQDVSNEEIFYIGGKAVIPESDVIIYLQSLHDGQTISEAVRVDAKGDWFYSYPKFLSPGSYLVWAQLKVGQETSAPSAQSEVRVAQTAIQLGASRLSLETLYLVFVFVLLLALLGIGGFIIYHGYHARRKQGKLIKEVREVEEVVKRGFLLLRRDLQAELAVINKNEINSKLSMEDQEKAQRLAKDLEEIDKIIEKEIRDVERILNL